MKALFPKGEPKEMQAEYEQREQNPKLGALTADTANLSPKNSADDMINLNNKLDVEYDLPITGSRTAKWYYSAFHNVTAMVGAGVLGLPSAFVFLGWTGGTITLVLSWFISLYTLHQLCGMHEIGGLRMNRYRELGQYAFGPILGWWAVQPFQLIVMVGLAITYSVTGGQSLKRFYEIVCTKHIFNASTGTLGCTAFGLSAWIVVFGAVQLFLAQAPNFNALTLVSLVAAVMSLSYSTIGFGMSLNSGLEQRNAPYNLDGYSTADGIFGAFNALGTVAFAYGGHNVVLEIQAGLPSPPKTYKPMMKGVYVAYAVVAWCYFTVAITGYWAFGNNVGSNVLLTTICPLGPNGETRHCSSAELEAAAPLRPVWPIAMANLMVVFHVLGSYQVSMMPVFDMIETLMAKKGVRCTRIFRLIYRSIYVVLTIFIACTIPFFGDLMGFIGAVGTGPTTFWLPSVIWLVVKRPSWRNWNFWVSWFIIILCVAVTFLGAIGALRGIVVDASDYDFYQ
ncbi:hypothetical protein WJX74_004645 [Apatococcus lobatus]|uniref:Amino acid transporter transmembrane domain-containing protein n=1 Tax=Apatococcus lobatus TaxID=904363 RepID=A0AAW1RDH1_9CHLO